MNVKIISITDFDYVAKDLWLWGETRVCSPNVPEVDDKLLLCGDDFSKFRITSKIKNVEDGLSNRIKVYTQNSIYCLEKIE